MRGQNVIHTFRDVQGLPGIHVALRETFGTSACHPLDGMCQFTSCLSTVSCHPPSVASFSHVFHCLEKHVLSHLLVPAVS